ncbi:AAA family ATPase [Paraburkholderia sp. BR14263]|uniref:AAA family ATPase n=2 Tax=Paraburkholderia TaxID=1822464 RepID=UPI0034CF3D0E
MRDEGARVYDLAAALEGMLDEPLDGRLLIVRHAQLALEGNGIALARLKLLLDRLSRHHGGRAAVVLISERFDVPIELEALLMVYGLALPSGDEIEAQVRAHYALAPDLLKRLAVACGGLNQAEIAHALSLADAQGTRRLDETALAVVAKQKGQVIAKGGVLGMVEPDAGADKVGGLTNLITWLKSRADVIRRLAEAKAFGVQAPKGVLIAGMPGCGKSLTAKVTATMFELPLLRLDIGSLLGKYVGESEHNMRRALQTAEAISPCVLWIDELEKAFVGMGGANASEVTSRLLGYFLTWMQEKSGAVFTIATANDITALPPELLRKGRFDEIFYVGFPDARERREILNIHLSRRSQDPARFDLAALTAQCRGFTGADMENAVNEALVTAFNEHEPLTQSRLEAAIAQTKPLRETMQKKVREYEEAFEKLKLKSASIHEGMSVAEMIRLAEGENPARRIDVATDEEVPEDLLEKLADDPELDVRRAVFEHPRCPESALSARINKGEGKGADTEIFALACAHRRAPVDQLERAIMASNFPEAVFLRVMRVTSAPERLLRAAGYVADGDKPLDRKNGIDYGYSYKAGPLQEALATNPNIGIDLQLWLVSNSAPAEIPRVLASNTSLHQAVQDLLATTGDLRVRVNLAHNRIVEAVQEKLAVDTSVTVRQALVDNPALTDAVQRTLANDADNKVRFKLAASEHETALLALLDSEDNEIVKAVLANPKMSERVIRDIMLRPLSDTLRLVNIIQTSFGVNERVLEELVIHQHHAVRHAVCEQLAEKLDDQKRIRLLYDNSIDADSRKSVVSRRVSEGVVRALLESESSVLRTYGCTLMEANVGLTLSEGFFELLQAMTNWRSGLIPNELLADHKVTNVRIQSALASHSSAEIRRRLARWNIDENVRRRLESDSDDSVRSAAAEGRALFGIPPELAHTPEL